MAAYLRFAIVLQSLISLSYVACTQQALLSVRTPVVYAVAGKSFSLDCIVNGTLRLASRVSWKHGGKWLHNQTQQLGTKVQLVLNDVRRRDDGIYQCSVYNFSGLSPNDDIPKDVNVTMLVGDAVHKPVCVSNGLMSPNVSLIWNAMDDYPGSFQFTYNVLYCYKPGPKNKFCMDPPFGYNTSNDCTGLSVDSSSRTERMVLECSVTSLFKRLFPSLYDVHAPRNTPDIFFSVNIGNIQSDAYSTSRGCDPTKLVKCTKPENVRVQNSKRGMLSLVWDYPRKMGDYTKLLTYKILHAADGSNTNKSRYFESGDPNRLLDINYDITGLHPYTIYHIYIACTINSYNTDNLGEFIGPFSARTAEEEPSSSPTFYKNLTSTVIHGQYRDVNLQWKLPDNKTWNGIITHIVLHYWKAGRSMPKDDASHVVVLSNVSMTTGNLTNLRLNESYVVVAQLCTRAGCGPQSESILITQENLPVGTPEPRAKKQGYFYLIIGITFGVLLSITFALLVARLWSKKLRRRRNQVKMKPLTDVIGKLSPPHMYESANESSNIEDSVDYDETIAPLLDGDKDSVKIKTSQPESPLLTRSEHDRADFQDSSKV